MRLLIAGCGDLGIRLGLRWAQAGGEVLALRRRAELLPAAFERVAIDLTQPLPRGLLDGELSAIAYLASADQRTPQAYRNTYVDGLQRLLDLLPDAPLRLLFASSTAVYGEDAGGWVDETTVTEPNAFNGHLLLEAEQRLHAVAPAATAVRLSGLYGPGRERLWQRARDGDPGAARWGNRVHIDDAAAALMHLLQLARPPALLCVSDDRPARDDEVLACLRQLQQVPAVPPLSAGAAETGRRVSNRQLRDSGFALRYPDFAAGYAARGQQQLPAALL